MTTAQATEVLLDAIADSDGTRSSVSERLLGVRVTDGILGSFDFDANGDRTSAGGDDASHREGKAQGAERDNATAASGSAVSVAIGPRANPAVVR
jgi:ABC-type branched-subunit amino acid transport system substrate-binding protein